MKLSPVQVKTLLFILRDVASKAELDHRFTDGHAADELVKLGLLRTHAGFYSITQQGRELAIAERKEASIEKQLKPVAVYVAKVPETISMSKPLDIEALSTPQSGLFKAPLINEKVNIQKGETMNAVAEKRSTNAVQIKYSPRDLVDVVVLRNQINKIDLYDEISIDNSHLRARMSRDLYNFKRANILIEDFDGLIRVGTKCNAYLAKHAGKKDTSEVIKFPKPSADFKLVDHAELTKDAKPAKAEPLEDVVAAADTEFEIPAFLRKSTATMSLSDGAEKTSTTLPESTLTFEYEATTVDSFEQAQAETRKDIEKLQRRVKFAYTDEHTMLIIEHDKLPLELDAESTKRLLDFANEISMVAVV